MVSTVTVTTGARLHFGPLAAAGSTGGRFGGVGMMISTPGYRLVARHSDVDEIDADTDTAARALEFVRRIRESLSGERTSAPCRLEFPETIPSHAGFGSGTQLALAIAQALSVLQGELDVPADLLARQTGRGLRSAIGLHGFAQGGFLVDGGRVGSGRLGTVVARVAFPADWRMILAAPSQIQGLSGADEQKAFASQPPMSQSLTAELCRITLMDWLPALIEADFTRVANAMYEFGLQVGRFFAPIQGGVFSHPAMRSLADEVRRQGFAGVAQTSWGPTIAILCDCDSVATQFVRDFSHESRWTDCTFQIAQPLNHGASVTATN